MGRWRDFLTKIFEEKDEQEKLNKEELENILKKNKLYKHFNFAIDKMNETMEKNLLKKKQPLEDLEFREGERTLKIHYSEFSVWITLYYDGCLVLNGSYLLEMDHYSEITCNVIINGEEKKIDVSSTDIHANFVSTLRSLTHHMEPEITATKERSTDEEQAKDSVTLLKQSNLHQIFLDDDDETIDIAALEKALEKNLLHTHFECAIQKIKDVTNQQSLKKLKPNETLTLQENESIFTFFYDQYGVHFSLHVQNHLILSYIYDVFEDDCDIRESNVVLDGKATYVDVVLTAIYDTFEQTLRTLTFDIKQEIKKAKKDYDLEVDNGLKNPINLIESSNLQQK